MILPIVQSRCRPVLPDHSLTRPLAKAHWSSYVSSMSNRASRQRRKAALAALPRFTSKELIGLKLMDINWEPIDPPWLDELPPPVTLTALMTEVRRRRSEMFQSMIEGAYTGPEI